MTNEEQKERKDPLEITHKLINDAGLAPYISRDAWKRIQNKWADRIYSTRANVFDPVHEAEVKSARRAMLLALDVITDPNIKHGRIRDPVCENYIKMFEKESDDVFLNICEFYRDLRQVEADAWDKMRSQYPERDDVYENAVNFNVSLLTLGRDILEYPNERYKALRRAAEQHPEQPPAEQPEQPPVEQPPIEQPEQPEQPSTQTAKQFLEEFTQPHRTDDDDASVNQAIQGISDFINRLEREVKNFDMNAPNAQERLKALSRTIRTATEMVQSTNERIEEYNTSRLSEQLSEQPPVEQPPVEQPPVEQPPVEQPPVEQPPVEQPPVEQPPVEQPPVEQPPAGVSDKKAWHATFLDATDKALRSWKDLAAVTEKTDKGKEYNDVTSAKKVLDYVTKAWNAAGKVRKYKDEESPEAEEAQRTLTGLAGDLDREPDKSVVKDVYDALGLMREATKELVANATDEASRRYYKGCGRQLKSAIDDIAHPAYERRFHEESPGERADRLYTTAIERLKIPKERLDDILSNVHELGWDSMFDLIDAVNDVYSARSLQGLHSYNDEDERDEKLYEADYLKQRGFSKARMVYDRLYKDIDWSISNDIFDEMAELYNTIRTSEDATIRMIARSFYDVLDDMGRQRERYLSEKRYNEYLDGIPKIPEDWKLSSDEKLKNLENLNDELEYLRSKDDTRKILDRFIPANASDPLRFLVEHYMPPKSDGPTAFEDWKNTEPILRELAKAYPIGVDEESTVNMLASLLQDAQKYYGDTHHATPYELYLSRLVREPTRTQEMMRNNDFLFEKGEYIKRLREAYSLEGEYRNQALNRILDDMSKDIASIRNLGASANDPLSRNLKGDMVFFREGANRFKKDLEQLRDAVMDNMNGGTAEPPGWTGFGDWADLLNPNNPLNGVETYMRLVQRDRDAEVERHYRNRRKFYPQYEVKDMWNNPRGDPQRIMNRLRKRGIIPGAQPGYSTQQGYTAQPIIGPEDFEELSAMVGPYYYNRERLDLNQPGLYEFSQKALRIASNLAFDLRNEADAEAVRQFEQALEIAGRCRKGAASGGQRGPRRITERGEANRVGSGNLTYKEKRDMYRGALRSI